MGLRGLILDVVQRSCHADHVQHEVQCAALDEVMVRHRRGFIQHALGVGFVGCALQIVVQLQGVTAVGVQVEAKGVFFLLVMRDRRDLWHGLYSTVKFPDATIFRQAVVTGNADQPFAGHRFSG